MNNFSLTNLMCKYTHKKPTLQYLNEEIEALKKWKNDFIFDSDLSNITLQLDSILDNVNELNFIVKDNYTVLDVKINDKITEINTKINALNQSIKSNSASITTLSRWHDAYGPHIVQARENISVIQEQLKKISIADSLPIATLDSPIIVFIVQDDGTCELYSKKTETETVFKSEKVSFIVDKQSYLDVLFNIPVTASKLGLEELGDRVIFNYLNDLDTNNVITSILILYNEGTELSAKYIDIANTLLSNDSSGLYDIESIEVFKYIKVF